MSAHPHDVGSGEVGITSVGVANYCFTCRDRVCFECGRTDQETGGGSWMSGHCFGCQGPVIRREDAERRSRENESAERRGAVKALRSAAVRWYGPFGPANSAQTSGWLHDRAKAIENGGDL